MKLPFKTGCMPDNLMFTPDIYGGSSKITIHNNKTIYIENFKCILKYCDNEIVIKNRQNNISIYGTGLLIEYYDHWEIRITGHIDGVNFSKVV